MLRRKPTVVELRPEDRQEYEIVKADNDRRQAERQLVAQQTSVQKQQAQLQQPQQQSQQPQPQQQRPVSPTPPSQPRT